jgi:hypothetical protein
MQAHSSQQQAHRQPQSTAAEHEHYSQHVGIPHMIDMMCSWPTARVEGLSTVFSA